VLRRALLVCALLALAGCGSSGGGAHVNDSASVEAQQGRSTEATATRRPMEETAGQTEGEERPEQAEQPQAQTDVPAYDVTNEQEADQYGQGVKAYSVTTEAASEADLRSITEALRAESPDADAVVVSFYPPRQTADVGGAGYAFASAEAARAVLGPGYPESTVEEIMRDDGLFVVSVEDTVADICAEASPEDREVMDCP